MKSKILVIASCIFFFSCSNNKRTTEGHKQLSKIKSDVLFKNTVFKPFSESDKNDSITLTITGQNFLEGIAIFKVVNGKGKEVHCEIFPAKKLIQADYKTANSVLQEAHIREVAEGFFVDDQDYKRPIATLPPFEESPIQQSNTYPPTQEEETGKGHI